MNFIIVLFVIFVFTLKGFNADHGESEKLLPLRKLLQLNKYYYNSCPNREKEWMTRCDIDAANDWNIYQGVQVFISL